jgi:hypothetical protein
VPPSILDIDSPILKLALVPAQAPALATATPPPSAPHLHTLHTLTACPLLVASLNSAVDTTPSIALHPVAREVQRPGPPKRVGWACSNGTIVHFDMLALARQVMRTGVGGVGVACGAIGRGDKVGSSKFGIS